MLRSGIDSLLVTIFLCAWVCSGINVPKIRVISFDAYCDDRRVMNVSFGPCQNHYIACHTLNGNVLAQCPRGQTFDESTQTCQSLVNLNPACYDLSVIGLTDITEQLAITTRTCDAGPGLYASFNDTCARQALLCLPNKQPQVITCPKGTYYNPNRLSCVPNAIICAYPEGRANIEDALVYAYCSYRPNLLTNAVGFAENRYETCPSWFVNCPNHEVIVCSEGAYYDSRQRMCRIPEPTDSCYRAHEDVCTGYEWRTMALASCSSAFRYCQGRRAIVYTCADNTVYDEQTGTCQKSRLVHSCPKCRPGERKPMKSNNTMEVCQNYLECRRWENPQSPWFKVACPEGTYYDVDQGRCWSNPAGACSRRAFCQDGSSFRVSCGDYVICQNGQYVASSCPHLTRWEPTQKTCVPDHFCVRFQPENNGQKSCRPGDIVGRPDCQSYSLCSWTLGRFEEKSCNPQAKNYEEHNFCSTCRQALKEPSQNAVTTTTEEQISLCTTQTLLILPRCKSAIYCQDGTPREWICPEGTLFNATSLQCSKDTQCLKPAVNADVVIFERVNPLNNPYSIDQPQFKQYPLLPPQQLSPQQYKLYETTRKDFCIPGVDPFRKADTIDCGVYHECYGNIYKRRACPQNSAFNPLTNICETDMRCNPIVPPCEEGKKIGLPKCGSALKCEKGAWVRRKCKGNRAFIDGKCHADILCDVSRPPPTCVEGSIMAAPTESECTRYLQCYGGQLYERQCSNGMRFDERYLACSLNAPCRPIPVCYEGDVKSHRKQCNKFLTCKDGSFVEAICPWKHVWNPSTKKCVRGSCTSDTPAQDVPKTNSPIVGGICVEKAGPNGFYPDPNDCRIFYQCASSKWVRKQCGPGTAFSSKIAVCDHLANVRACRNQQLN